MIIPERGEIVVQNLKVTDHEAYVLLTLKKTRCASLWFSDNSAEGFQSFHLSGKIKNFLSTLPSLIMNQ